MENYQILIVSTDESYVQILENKMVWELEEYATIHIITDMEYLEIYLQEYRKIDLLVIEDRIYSDKFKRHEVSNIIFLIDSKEDSKIKINNTEKYANKWFLYKYQGIKENYAFIEKIVKEELGIQAQLKEETKMIGMYSPIGGIGLTTTSLRLAMALGRENFKVLYISFDAVPIVSELLEINQVLEEGVAALIKNREDKFKKEMKQFIHTEKAIDIWYPFRQTISTYHFTREDYQFILDSVKEELNYDFIIVELARELNFNTTGLMEKMDKNIILAGQDKHGIYKMNYLFTQLDCSNQGKFVLWCNKYDINKENYLENSQMLKGIAKVSRYLANLEEPEEYISARREDEEMRVVFTDIL